MSQTTDSIKDDIAYMSSLAREGHMPTYAGGEFLLMAGVIFGGTSFAVAASLAGYLPVTMNVLWPISMVLFAITQPILIVRSRRRGAFRMVANRTIGAAWTSIGWAIFTLAVASAIIAWRLGTQVHLALSASIILALYGVGWAVSASLSERPWNKILTVGSFISAIVVAALVQWPAAMFAAYGVALVLLAALPGAIWMRLSAKAQAA